MRKVKILVILALVCGFYFLGVLICMHFVRADLDHFATPVSYYRVGPNSFVLSSAFAAGAVAEMILVVLLRFAHRRDKKNISLFGRYALLLAAVSLFVTGLVKVGTLHWLGALLHTLLFPFAIMLIGYSTCYDATRRVSKILSVMTTVTLFTLSEAFDGNGVFHAYFGLLEKVDIALMMVWCFIMLVSVYHASLLRGAVCEEGL